MRSSTPTRPKKCFFRKRRRTKSKAKTTPCGESAPPSSLTLDIMSTCLPYPSLSTSLTLRKPKINIAKSLLTRNWWRSWDASTWLQSWTTSLFKSKSKCQCKKTCTCLRSSTETAWPTYNDTKYFLFFDFYIKRDQTIYKWVPFKRASTFLGS
jgi:hypothetical protein